jgi:hypothetical protein
LGVGLDDAHPSHRAEVCRNGLHHGLEGLCDAWLGECKGVLSNEERRGTRACCVGVQEDAAHLLQEFRRAREPPHGIETGREG